MTALPTALYRDPERIVSDAEQGDVMPVTRHEARTCLQCTHCRPAHREPPCAIHCCPSPMTGRCACWEGEA